MTFCVYASASDHIDNKYIHLVEKLGEQLATDGHSLIFGGGNTGLMGAIARGFYSGNGHVIGVIPRFITAIEPTFVDCTTIIYTDDMSKRKEILEKECDAFLVLPGGIGTFDEFFEILTLKQLGRHSKDICIININGYFDKLFELIDYCIQNGFADAQIKNLFHVLDYSTEQ